VRDLDVLFDAGAHATRLDPRLRNALGPVGIAIPTSGPTPSPSSWPVSTRRAVGASFQRLGAFTDSPARRRRQDRLGSVAPRLIAPVFRAVRGGGRRLTPDSPPADFHRLRVLVKRLRYALETLRGLGGKPVRRLLARLEELQDLLGESQDAVVHLAWLRAYATRPGSPTASLLPVGALIRRSRAVARSAAAGA
jgi:hypothetical protein